MTAAESIEFYKHGLQFEFTANKAGSVSGGGSVVRTGLATAGSNITSRSTAFGKGRNIRQVGNGGLAGRRGFASASVALSESVMSAPQAPVSAKLSGHLGSQVDLKPASDVLAGAMARAASQSTIHPLDTLKVRMQAGASKSAMSKFGRLVPPPSGVVSKAAVKRALPQIADLYRGVIGAASGAGIAIGAYFAFYGAATNVLVKHTRMNTGEVAFCAGAIAAAGGSVVKVPLAVCIRSVQAGVYPNVFSAARSITDAAGTRGLFTGYLPTLLEDVPDMAFKFAAYESLRSLRLRLMKGRKASAQEDFCMGAVSGAFAAAATTPLDVIKTRMMCTAASRPSMRSAAAKVWTQGGPTAFFNGVGPRALSNGINSAVFFAFFEMLRRSFKRHASLKAQATAAAAAATASVIAAEGLGPGGAPRAVPSPASMTVAAPASFAASRMRLTTPRRPRRDFALAA